VHEAITAVIKERGVDAGNIGLEEDCCTVSTFQKLQALLPKATFKYASEIFQLARTVKEPEEIKLIRESVSIGESALKVAIETAKPGGY